MHFIPNNRFDNYIQDFEKDTLLPFGDENLSAYLVYSTFRNIDEIYQYFFHFDQIVGEMIWRPEFRNNEKVEPLIKEIDRTRHFFRAELRKNS